MKYQLKPWICFIETVKNNVKERKILSAWEKYLTSIFRKADSFCCKFFLYSLTKYQFITFDGNIFSLKVSVWFLQ